MSLMLLLLDGADGAFRARRSPGMRRLSVAAFASEHPSRSVLRPQPFGPPLHFAEFPR